MMASMRSRSPLARVRPGSPASTWWSLRVHMIRSPSPAAAPSAMVTVCAVVDQAEAEQVSRTRRDSSRRRAWSAAISSASVSLAARAV